MSITLYSLCTVDEVGLAAVHLGQYAPVTVRPHPDYDGWEPDSDWIVEVEVPQVNWCNDAHETYTAVHGVPELISPIANIDAEGLCLYAVPTNNDPSDPEDPVQISAIQSSFG